MHKNANTSGIVHMSIKRRCLSFSLFLSLSEFLNKLATKGITKVNKYEKQHPKREHLPRIERKKKTISKIQL